VRLFIAPRSRKKAIPLRMILPNALTTVALCSGLASIHYSLKASHALQPAEAALNWDRALMAVGVAVIFDMLDGRAARLLKASSSFGAIMDSLSDFLSFGVAPGILLHEWLVTRYKINDSSVFVLAALMTFALCSALRLARFTANVKPPPRPGSKPSPLATHFFTGMPTPSAAAAVLVPPMLVTSRLWERNHQTLDRCLDWWMVVLFTFLIALLMISRIPMFSFKKIRVRRRLVAPFLVGIGLVVVMLAYDLWLTISLVSLAYVCTIPLSVWYYKKLKAQVPPEPSEALAGAENAAGWSGPPRT
jgi:CDP-diacylglycerol--serine O-phosphatidyltransferase